MLYKSSRKPILFFLQSKCSQKIRINRSDHQLLKTNPAFPYEFENPATNHIKNYLSWTFSA